MAQKMFDVVVAGHVCLDVTPRIPDIGVRQISELMIPGSLINVGQATVSPGGSVSNTGLCLIRLGVRTGLMGKIGNDFLGRGIADLFKQYEADKALVVVDGESTSFTVVLAPPGIDRFFLHHPGANDTFSAADINYCLVEQARLFHLGYPPLMRKLYSDNGAELIEIFRRVKALGVTTSLDMALPDPHSESGRIDWSAILDRLLPHVDIAPFSAEEAMFMLNRARFDALRSKAGQGDALDAYTTEDLLWIAEQILARGAKIAVVKCGHRGMLLVTAEAKKIRLMGSAMPRHVDCWACRELWEDALVVDRIASATGAGDTAIAGFLTGLLNGLGPEQTLAAACCVGAQNLHELDAVSGIHSWEETLAMMPGWAKRNVSPGTDWSYDSEQRLWRGPNDGKDG